jgi:uncharacterized protein (TIGR03086 family)
MTNAVGLLGDAVAQTAAIVRSVPAEAMSARSPCEEWDTRAVINHTIGAMRMFAAVIDEGSVDAVGLFSADLVGTDAARSFEEAGAAVVERFGRPGVLDSTLDLPFGKFPASFGIALLTNDVVVHGWDIAKASGQQPVFDAALTDACLAFAIETFSNPAYRGDDFAPAVDPGRDATPVDRLVAYLGRTP